MADSSVNFEAVAKTLFRVLETVRKMLLARGYDVPLAKYASWKELKQTFENGTKRESLWFVAEKRITSGSSNGGALPETGEGGAEAKVEKILVLFAEEAKIQSKEIKKYSMRMNRMNVFRAILVVDEPVTGAARTVLTSLPNLHIEPFKTQELIIDITEHELVPLHMVLTDEEKKLVLKRYNLNESQLPRMFTHDPIARYFGLSRGNVVKIIRSSETAGRYVTYRIVADA